MKLDVLNRGSSKKMVKHSLDSTRKAVRNEMTKQLSIDPIMSYLESPQTHSSQLMARNLESI